MKYIVTMAYTCVCTENIHLKTLKLTKGTSGYLLSSRSSKFVMLIFGIIIAENHGQIQETIRRNNKTSASRRLNDEMINLHAAFLILFQDLKYSNESQAQLWKEKLIGMYGANFKFQIFSYIGCTTFLSTLSNLKSLVNLYLLYCYLHHIRFK